jgi:hypothetical protein
MKRRVGFLTVLAVAFLLLAGPAQAAPSAGWHLESFATPTNFSTAHGNAYVLTATDVGALPTDGSEVVLTDTLPAGLTANSVKLRWSGYPARSEKELAPGHCTTTPLRCALPASFFAEQGKAIQPADTLRMIVGVAIGSPPSESLLNTAAVEGGGAARVKASAENRLSEALPPFGIPAFSNYLAGPDGQPPLQAGEHPYHLLSAIGLANAFVRSPETQSDDSSVEDPRDILVDLPPGLAASALSAPTCTFAQLGSFAAGSEEPACPAASAAGHLRTNPENHVTGINGFLYHMTPEHGVAAEYAFRDTISGTHALYASLVPSSAGYVLRVTSPEITQISLTDVLTQFFGDPAAHDAGRGPQPADVPTFTNPANCDGQPLITTIHADSWQNPAHWAPGSGAEPDFSEPAWASATYESEPVTGCEALAGHFNPEIEATPTTNQGDKPSGLDVTLKVPQHESIETLGTPPLKKAVVTLPAGMTVNPSSANGLQGCSLAQIGVSPSGQPNAAAPHCPDAAKIGSLELKTPALPGVLQGSIYVAKQSENPFKSLLAIYLVVDDPTTGVLVKLPGEVKADPTTGRLTTIVDNSPQFPFSELKTHFFGGQRAALRTPAVCGTYEVTSELTPWSAPQSGPPAEPAGSFQITQGCAKSPAAEPNAPSFEAGTLSPIAATYSPFVLKLHREDGSQPLQAIETTLPPGLIGRLAGITECSEAQLAAAAARSGLGEGAAELANPSCPAASQVGTDVAGLGAGLNPFYIKAPIYLAGPYKGAPLSLAVITPALAGPYDLGTVLVRAALYVNPETAQITAKSDPIPSILDGLPSDVRSIAIKMDRNQFTLNPTNCERKAITGAAISILGQSAALSNPFQVGGCQALGFKPKLAISLKGPTKRAGNPALKAVLTYPTKGAYANIAKAAVTLPHSEFLDNAHIGTVCTRVQFAEGNASGEKCPAASIYGFARAETPLLEKPVEGPVYLRSPLPGHKLPDLVAALNGQIDVALVGKIDTGKGGGIRNTFEVVPDAPVTKFTLEMKGGSKGLLVNSEDICAKPQRAVAHFTAQNGKVDDFNPLIANSCKAKKHKGSHKRHHRGKR